jgi:hypothetical protein
MVDEIQFGYEGFETLLRRVREAGYAFERLDRPEAGANAPTFFLRHDVDISPFVARTLGEIEHRLGIVASFYFLLGADTYSIFDANVLDIMRRLRSQGHCVGLHIDQTVIAPDADAIEDTLAWFSNRVLPIDRAISFHRPEPAVLGRHYARFWSAYDPSVFSPETYLSDSRRSLQFFSKLTAWLEDGRPRLQLLLHPEWWHPHATIEGVWADLAGRRQADLRAYVATNFPSVFGGIVAAEEKRANRTPGV